MFRRVIAICTLLAASAIPTNAQDLVSKDIGTSSGVSTEPGAEIESSLPPVSIGSARRGSLLPSLYVTLTALNAWDAYSTTQGLAKGAREANPLMREVAGNTVALWAIKAGATA